MVIYSKRLNAKPTITSRRGDIYKSKWICSKYMMILKNYCKTEEVN